MNQAAIRQLITNGIAAALEAQAAAMANADNPNRNTRQREIPIAKRGNYKQFISCQPFYFNGTEGAVVETEGVSRAGNVGFEMTGAVSVFEIYKCAEDDKVKFSMCTFEGRALNLGGTEKFRLWDLANP
ncbi:hypothetical protein Tco_1304786 [Tanacetum coccineum]